MDEVSAVAAEDAREELESPEIEAAETCRPQPVRKRGRPRLDAPGAAVLPLVRILSGVWKNLVSYALYAIGSSDTDSTSPENLSTQERSGSRKP